MPSVSQHPTEEVPERNDAEATSYRLELVDAPWLVRNVRCADACPVDTRSGLYITLLADGDFEAAYRYARMPNPFASACGRICAHPCEQACNRSQWDAPLRIRALKRFLTERFGVESRRVSDLRERLELQPAPPRPEKVAIVGAGPAGLACAHDLALLGYRPVVFDSAPVAGGMLRLGVPEYRLPSQLLQREIDFIKSLGVEIRLNVRIGSDVTLEELRRDYAALFLACGAHKARDIPIPGRDLEGVLKGIEFLRRVNLGQEVTLGKRVAVLGGGNVAFDVARAAIREATAEVSSPETEPTERAKAAHEALDVARAARFLGAEVHIVCLEPRDAMLADEEEVTAAGEEGIYLHTSRGPKAIVADAQGKVAGVETLAVKSIFDDQGRFSPTYLEGSAEVVEVDTVIMAIGQAVDPGFVGPDDGVGIRPNGTVKVEPETLATSVENVFAGGDAAFGPRIVINAIADGRTTAESIHSYLTGKPVAKAAVEYSALHRRHYLPRGDYDRRPRVALPMLPAERRIGITEVEQCLDEGTAVFEAGRCLHCFYNVAINPHKCILCGRCAEACPVQCIKMVSLDQIDLGSSERAYLAEVQPDYLSDDVEAPDAGTPDAGTPDAGMPRMAMIQDEEICIRCGQCVAACPADACTMMRIEMGEGGPAEAVAAPVGTGEQDGQAE